MIGREEGNVQRRDGAYPDFIRALGGTAQARSAEPSATIKALRGVDFGMLDASIDRLERRLATVLIPTELGITSMQIRIPLSFHATLEFTSKDHNHPVSLPKLLRWCLDR